MNDEMMSSETLDFYAREAKSHHVHELIAEVRRLRDRVLNAESENVRYAEILDGTWPNSKEILEAALAKVKP